MDLLKTLKNFKSIEPDRGFTEKSRREILNLAERPLFSPVKTILRSLEFAASLSLAGVLIFVILGGLSSWSIFAPSPLNALDSQKIKAEAEAININIELADLLYRETEAEKKSEAQAESTKPVAVTPEEESTSGEGENEIISIDEALRLLSQ